MNEFIWKKVATSDKGYSNDGYLQEFAPFLIPEYRWF